MFLKAEAGGFFGVPGGLISQVFRELLELRRRDCCSDYARHGERSGCMFEKGELIIYGSKGVCEVTDISTINISGVSKDKLYYILRPVNDRDGRVFTPVDSEKTIMRRILGRGEALALIGSIPDIGHLWVADERQREQNYKQALNSCDCREWIKIIKTLWMRNKERLSQGKKITAMDKKYFKLAEDNLYAELSASLGLPQEKMQEFITEKVEQMEESFPKKEAVNAGNL